MIRIAAATLLAALLAALARAEQDDPRRWLDDMNRAFAELSYDGIFSYYSGQELATLRIVHMVVDGEQRERLVHLNGAPRQILRRGEEVVFMVAPVDALLAGLGNVQPLQERAVPDRVGGVTMRHLELQRALVEIDGRHHPVGWLHDRQATQALGQRARPARSEGCLRRAGGLTHA